MNLFHKYGGAEFWSDFLNVFYSRITSSDILSHHYVDKDIEHIKVMLIGLLEITLVAQGSYSKEDILTKHKNMGITKEELDEWIAIYVETVKELGVSESDCDILLSIVGEYKSSVVPD